MSVFCFCDSILFFRTFFISPAIDSCCLPGAGRFFQTNLPADSCLLAEKERSWLKLLHFWCWNLFPKKCPSARRRKPNWLKYTTTDFVCFLFVWLALLAGWAGWPASHIAGWLAGWLAHAGTITGWVAARMAPDSCLLAEKRVPPPLKKGLNRKNRGFARGIPKKQTKIIENHHEKH